jgi:hypothetical protein
VAALGRRGFHPPLLIRRQERSMQDDCYLVTVYRHEVEKDREAFPPKEKTPAILGIVERIGSGELSVFHSRAEVIELLGFAVRRGDGHEAR